MKLDWREKRVPRPLKEKELAILNRLLEFDFEGREKLLRQLENVEVSAEYETSGYPTIKLSVIDGTDNSAKVIGRVPVEARGKDEDGENINFLLHVINGFLAELEIFRNDGEPIKKLPEATTLEVY